MCYMHSRNKRVGVRELRQNLSVHLRRVLRGETLEVTDRGHAVALLAPLPKPTSVLDRLHAEGRLIPATSELLPLKRRPIRIDRPSLQLLDEQRADRRL
jgi:antitoxin (DNA-binding transcriptional repressor) of toxin-antitoxin stability system